jgi:hypothetical protein
MWPCGSGRWPIPAWWSASWARCAGWWWPSPDYLARRGTPLEPADLAEHDIILTTVVSASPEWRFERQGKVRAVRLEPRLRVNNVEAALAAMLAGRGVGRALSYQVAQDLAAGRLVRLLPDFEPPPLPVQLVTVGGRFMPPLVRAFLDFAGPRLERLAVLREVAAKDPPPSRGCAMPPPPLSRVRRRAALKILLTRATGEVRDGADTRHDGGGVGFADPPRERTQNKTARDRSRAVPFQSSKEA